MHEHDWRLKAKTFAEPDLKTANEKLEEFLKNPPVLYRGEYIKHHQVSDLLSQPKMCAPILQLPDDISLNEIVRFVDITPIRTVYERMKHGVTTFVWACVCGEIRKEECLGREPSNER